MNFFKTTMSAGQISQLHALLPDRVRSNRRPVIRVADWMNIWLGRQGGHIKLENSVSFKYLQINYG